MVVFDMRYCVILFFTCVVEICASSKSVDYLNFACPIVQQWNIRAYEICNKTDQYYCLYDENEHSFREMCQEKPWFDRAGFKIHFVGNMHRVPCNEDGDERYQPYKFWTNGSESCRFQKSVCEEEGQVIANNGTVKSDRLCRCDYSRNYAYIITPKDPCSCNPSEEDCSCYIKSCEADRILSPEYQCVLTTEWKERFRCPLIRKKGSDGTNNVSPVEITMEIIEISSSAGVLSVIILVMGVILLIVTGTAFYACISKEASIYSRDIHIELAEVNGINSVEDEAIANNVLELQHYEMEIWKRKLQKFVDTNASAYTFNMIKKEKCVIITGPPGSGKSAIAFHVAFKLMEVDGYEIFIVTDPNDIFKFSTTDKKQLFIVDNAFGNYSLNENSVSMWTRQGKLLQNLLSRNIDTKLVMTCKTHVYLSIKIDQVPITHVHCSLVSDTLQYTPVERRKIAMAYINDDGIPDISDDRLMLFPFFPSICSLLPSNPTEALQHYFLNPYEFVNEDLENFRTNAEVYYFALCLLVIKNNCIPRAYLREDNTQNDLLLDDLSKDIDCATYPTKKQVLDSLFSLKGSYTSESDLGLSCINSTMFDLVAYYTSKYCLKSILKYAESSFFKNKIVFESLCAEHPAFAISLPDNLEELYFARLLGDLRKGAITDIFTDAQNEILEFRMSFIRYLKTNLKSNEIQNSKDGSSYLHVVSAEGYEEYVRFFVEFNKGLINQSDNQGRTSLHYASLNGRAAVTKLLIDNDSSKDITDYDDRTPLDLACERGHHSVVDILLSNRARIRQRTTDLRTALHDNCKNGNLKITKLLLSFNAKVNVVDKDGKTPLYIATSKRFYDIVSLLLKQDGVDVNRCENKGRTPLLVLCKGKYTSKSERRNEKKAVSKILDLDENSSLHYSSNYQAEIVQRNGKDVDIADESKTAIFHSMVSKEDQNIAELLLKHNADINCCDNNKRSPLITVCQMQNLQLAKFLLEHNAKINIVDSEGKTALHYACDIKCPELITLLLNYDAMVNIRDKHGNTPLHIACSKGLVCATQQISSGVKDINRQNKDKMTPLMLASKEGHQEIVIHLIKLGASVNSKQDTKTNSLLEACRQNEKDIAEILIKNGAQVNLSTRYGITPLIACCDKGYKDLAAYLLNHEADVNLKDIDGLTPFNIACREEHIDTMKILCEFGANINEPDKDGWTPLYLACKEHKTNIVCQLLQFEVDVNKACNKGMSPLHIACMNGYTDVIELLFKNNVSTNLQDNFGQTPLIKATSAGHIRAVKLLLDHGASVDIQDSFKFTPATIAVQKRYTDIEEMIKQKSSQIHNA